MVASCCLKVGGDLNPFSFSFYFLAFYCCCFEFSGPFVFAFDNKSDSRDDIAPFEICCAFRFWRKPETTFILFLLFSRVLVTHFGHRSLSFCACMCIYTEDDEKNASFIQNKNPRRSLGCWRELQSTHCPVCVCVLLLQSIRLRTAARNQPSDSRGWDSVSIRTFGKW